MNFTGRNLKLIQMALNDAINSVKTEIGYLQGGSEVGEEIEESELLILRYTNLLEKLIKP